MQAIKAVLRQKWVWACQNKPFWVSLFLTAITMACIAATPAKVNGTFTDLPVRLWGMCLQIIGACTVWMDLTKTAKDFGEEPSFRKTRKWLTRLFRTAPPIHGSVSADLEVDYMIMTGHVMAVTQTGRPVEERLAQLEKQVAVVSEELSIVRGDIMKQKKELTADIKQRAADLRQELNVVQAKLKDALIGNYAVLHFGAGWLLVGIVLSSVAVEITNAVHLHQLPRLW